MISENIVPRTCGLLACALLAIFLWQTFSASGMKSTTHDEPPHIAAGLSYLATGRIRMNPQQPPLLKELSALSLLLGGVRWPDTPQTMVAEGGGATSLEWSIGNSIITDNGPNQVMFWARLPMILVASMLGYIIYAWGSQMLGEAAAVGALFLYVLDPIVVAHSYLVTMDSGFAAFSMLFFFTLWRYLQRPGWKRLLCCGIALGAAMCAKFSGIALVPLGAVLMLAALRWPLPAPLAGIADKSAQTTTPRAAPAPNDRCYCGSGRRYSKCHGAQAEAEKPSRRPPLDPRTLRGAGIALLGMLAAAFVVIQAIYLFPWDLFAYTDGFSKVYADHNPDYKGFLGGQFKVRFPSYFAAAYLLKEPVASIVLVLIGLVLVVRGRSLPVTTKLFLLLPPAVLFAGYTFSAANIGVRYLIPVLPFTHLLGGAGLASMIRNTGAWKRVLALVLCGWVMVAAAGIYPDHLAYFNEMACLVQNPSQVGLDGGTRCGPLWLDDSNVDWGQGLKQLKAWLDENSGGRTVRLAYFGTIPPEAYGIRHEKLSLEELIPDPKPGLYVVSAHLMVRAVGFGGTWLRRAPAAIIGHSLYVYDIR